MGEFDLLPWEIEIYAFIIGICLGSFLNVVIYRLPKGLSIVKPRSMCPACGKQIAWYDNLPLVSYLILRGRCRGCGVGISARYFMVELVAGFLTVAVYIRFGLNLRAVIWLYFALSLVAITFIDLDEMIIPDRITLPGIVIGLIAAIILPDLILIGPWLGSKLLDLGLTGFRLHSLIGSILGMFLGGGIIWLIFNLYFFNSTGGRYWRRGFHADVHDRGHDGLAGHSGDADAGFHYRFIGGRRHSRQGGSIRFAYARPLRSFPESGGFDLPVFRRAASTVVPVLTGINIRFQDSGLKEEVFSSIKQKFWNSRWNSELQTGSNSSKLAAPSNGVFLRLIPRSLLRGGSLIKEAKRGFRPRLEHIPDTGW